MALETNPEARCAWRPSRTLPGKLLLGTSLSFLLFCLRKIGIPVNAEIHIFQTYFNWWLLAGMSWVFGTVHKPVIEQAKGEGRASEKRTHARSMLWGHWASGPVFSADSKYHCIYPGASWANLHNPWRQTKIRAKSSWLVTEGCGDMSWLGGACRKWCLFPEVFPEGSFELLEALRPTHWWWACTSSLSPTTSSSSGMC